jgi:iron complex transport system substrate-binding protein
VVNGSGGDTLIRLAGGKNIAGNLTSGDISNEWVIERNPDIVIKVGLNYASKANMTETRSAIMNRTGMPSIKAVKDGKVYVISSTLTFGPKGFIGLLEVAKIIHPELFGDIDPAKVMEQYDSQFVPGAKNGNFIVP